MNLNSVIQNDINEIIDNPIDWEKLKGKTVLITGAMGMIATYLVYTLLSVDQLFQLNLKVIGLVRDKNRADKHFKLITDNPRFSLLVGDVTNNNLYDNLKIDYIIHAASQTNAKQFMTMPVETIKTNVNGTINLLELAKKNNAKFLLLSTREVYGKNNQLDSVRENEIGIIDYTQIRSCYPESKRMSELLCLSYQNEYNIDCKIARIEHVYGPGITLGDGRVMGDFIAAIVKHNDIIMKSEGLTELSLTYISDVVSGLMLLLLNFKDTIYNLSDDKTVFLVKDLAQYLCELFKDRNIKLVKHIMSEEAAKGYLQHKVPLLNSNKAINEGWNKKVSFKDGIYRVVSYYDMGEVE